MFFENSSNSNELIVIAKLPTYPINAIGEAKYFGSVIANKFFEMFFMSKANRLIIIKSDITQIDNNTDSNLSKVSISVIVLVALKNGSGIL